MQAIGDIDLLAAYARDGDQDAFARIVQHHIDWIHSAARRLVRDCHAADDIAQAVFLVLAQRRPKFPTEGAVLAWLFRTTHFAAANWHKSEARRHRREQLAAAVTEAVAGPPAESDWQDISPLLDQALAHLGRSDQRAILLRFFRGRSLAQVGEDLGITEEAARKRLARAVARLRDDLTRQGVTISAGALAAVVGVNAVEAAPAGLANSVVAGVGGASASGVAVGLAKGAMTMMTWAQVKVALAIAAVLLFAVPPVAIVMVKSAPTTGQAAGPTSRSTATFAEVYDLQLGELVRFIPPPYPPGREQRLAEFVSGPLVPGTLGAPVRMLFYAGHMDHFAADSSRSGTVRSAIDDCGDLTFPELDVPEALASVPVIGDWTIDPNAPRDRRIKAVEAILRRHLGRPITIEKRLVSREVLVITGRYAFQSLNAGRSPQNVQLFTDSLTPRGGGGTADFNGFLARIEDMTGTKLINEAQAVPNRISWSDNSITPFSEFLNDPGKVDLLMQNVSIQTSLRFNRENRDIEVYYVREERR